MEKRFKDLKVGDKYFIIKDNDYQYGIRESDKIFKIEHIARYVLGFDTVDVCRRHRWLEVNGNAKSIQIGSFYFASDIDVARRIYTNIINKKIHDLKDSIQDTINAINNWTNYANIELPKMSKDELLGIWRKYYVFKGFGDESEF